MTEAAQNLPTSGTLKDGEHFLPMRVYFEDTDALGMVYHSNYLKFMERGRTEFLRKLGISNVELADRADGMTWAVKDCTIDYASPAKLDDAIVVISRTAKLGAASVTIDQEVVRDGEVLASASIRVACMDRDGKPKRMPRDLREKFEPLVKS